MEERRRFFRIDDKVGLRFKAITQEDWNQFKESGKVVVADSQAQPCQGLEQQLTDAIDNLKSVSVEAAEVAWLLNAKINGLAELISVDSTLPELIKSMDVNISACGMAFRGAQLLQLDQLLYMEITLKSLDDPMVVLAKVVHCNEESGGEGVSSEDDSSDSSGSYLTRVDFCDIEPDAQELLIQYVVKQQGQLLKQRKHQK